MSKDGPRVVSWSEDDQELTVLVEAGSVNVRNGRRGMVSLRGRSRGSGDGWARKAARRVLYGTAHSGRKQARARSDAKMRAARFRRRFDRGGGPGVVDYQAAVQLAAVTGDAAFLEALRNRASGDALLSACVEDWADAEILEHDAPELVAFAEEEANSAAGLSSDDLMELRRLLQEVLDQVREDPVVIMDLVKQSLEAEDKLLEIVIQVAVAALQDMRLDRMVEAAREAYRAQD